MFKLGLYWISYVHWLVLVPLYACLAPLCMISSGLFDWLISWFVEDQTFALVSILAI